MGLISQKYKFVFVHISKTGGTSVIKALQNACGNDIEYIPELDHITPQEIRKFYPYDFSNYIFIAIVRHPLELLYSYYCYKRGNTQNLSELCNVLNFKDFVKYWYISTFGEYLLDQGQHTFTKKNTKIFKLENLNETLPKFFKETFGIDFLLQHINKSRKESILFSNKTRKLVYDKFKKDFDLFNYDPYEGTSQFNNIKQDILQSLRNGLNFNRAK